MAMGYTTTKEVVVRDKRVIVTYWISLLGILTYIIGYQMLWQRAYLVKAEARGTVQLQLSGYGYFNHSNNLTVLDEVDLVPIPLENNAAFVATAIYPLLVQRQCVPDGVEYTKWCPDERSASAMEPKAVFQDSQHNISICYQSQVSFPALHDHELYRSTDMGIRRQYPASHFNCISMLELATMAGGSLDRMCGGGCVVQMNIHWDCDVDRSGCQPSFKVTRLNSHQEARTSPVRTVHYREGTHDTVREVRQFDGMRILVLVDGQGWRVSLVAIFTQLGAAIGLLSLASMLADRLLKNLYRIDPKRGKLYKRFKVEEAPNIAAMDEKEIEILEHSLDVQDAHLFENLSKPADDNNTKRDDGVLYHHLQG